MRLELLKNHRARVLLCILLTGVIWETVFILGISDRFFFSAPSEIIRVFADLGYLRRIASFSFILIILTLLGFGVGITVGTLGLRSPRFVAAVLSLEHTAIWMPFLLLWALPIWPVQPDRLILTFGPIWIVATLAVAMYVCTLYLAARTSINEIGADLRSRLVQDGLRQALFFYLIAQILGRPSYGWPWYIFTPSHGAAVGFATAIVLVVMHYLINRLRVSDSDRETRIRRALVFESKKSSTLGGLFFCLLLILAWHLLAAGGPASVLGSPLNSAREAYKLLSGSIRFPTSDNTFWDHLAFSASELFAGLFLSLVISTLLANRHSTFEKFRKLVAFFICRGAGPTIVLPVFFIFWVPKLAVPWATVIMIMCLSLYPMIHALRDFSDHSYLYRFLVAIYQALPYSFVGVFAGEALRGEKGVGFLTVLISQSTKSVDTPIAVCLLSILILYLLTWTLRAVLPAQRELSGQTNE